MRGWKGTSGPEKTAIGSKQVNESSRGAAPLLSTGVSAGCCRSSVPHLIGELDRCGSDALDSSGQADSGSWRPAWST